ncbi:MAG: redoxin, partial [Bacteroidetes bacterium]
MRWQWLLLFCSIYRVVEMTGQNVTFSKDVAPILQTKCVPCHYPEGIGTMPLTTYSEVVSYAKMIGFVTQTRLMPPFRAETSDFAIRDARQLSDDEIN